MLTPRPGFTTVYIHDVPETNTEHITNVLPKFAYERVCELLHAHPEWETVTDITKSAERKSPIKVEYGRDEFLEMHSTGILTPSN
ncbi:MAG: hypothetical protein JWL80_684 [Parcubacteria group bacterium]|nr:hypothetical protein [Parcubacteria group bacterium]